MRKLHVLLVCVAGCSSSHQLEADSGGGGGGDARGGGSGSAMDAQAADAPSADAPTDAPTVAPNVVFVTSTTYTIGQLGGLTGADAACNARAAAAGLAGNYVAWLSTSTENAKSRLGNASGWVRVDGRPVANTVADLAAGKLLYPIAIDEAGNARANVSVWTGTKADGTVGPNTCNNFTTTTLNGIVGSSIGGTVSWTANSATSCASALSIYCFGIDRSATVSASAPTARKAFMTSSVFLVAGGLAGADALCATEASAYGLAGTYHALLPTTSATEISRFDTNGNPWARRDGVLLGATAADLAGYQNNWLAMPDVAADGSYLGPVEFWGVSSTSPLPATDTCNDWTSAAATDNGRQSTASAPGYGSEPCDSTNIHVLCLQL